MPIYEYVCPDCGRFEVIQKITEDALTKCPQCKDKGKNSAVTRAVSASAFHLKGSGWYKTDYSSSSSSSSGSTASSDKAAAAAPSESSSSTTGGDAGSSGGGSEGGGGTTKGSCGSSCGCH